MQTLGKLSAVLVIGSLLASCADSKKKPERSSKVQNTAENIQDDDAVKDPKKSVEPAGKEPAGTVNVEQILKNSKVEVPPELKLVPEPLVKPCHAMLDSMSKATGIQSSNPKVLETYESVKSGCPTRQDLQSLTSDNVSTMVQLSLAYCNQYAPLFIETKGVRNLSFDSDPYEAYAKPEVRKELYITLYRDLWGRDRKSAQSLGGIESQLEAAVTELTANKIAKAENVSETQHFTLVHSGVIETLCSMYLMGAPVLGK